MHGCVTRLWNVLGEKMNRIVTVELTVMNATCLLVALMALVSVWLRYVMVLHSALMGQMKHHAPRIKTKKVGYTDTGCLL